MLNPREAGQRATRRQIMDKAAIQQHATTEVVAQLARLEGAVNVILFQFAGSSEMTKHCENLAWRIATAWKAPDEIRDLLAKQMIEICRAIEAID